MTALANTSAAVLGMVALGARSGYEIQRAAERSVRFFWVLGAPQVYSELKKLEAAGFVTGRDEARGSRARRVFEVTDPGRDALRAWVAAEDPSPLELRDGELLRLFFADALEGDAALERVRAMRDRSRRALEHFRREIEPAAAVTADAGARFPAHVAGFGRELHEFVVGWCDRLEARLTEHGERR